MNGILFQNVMRGEYKNGVGYSGWTEEYASSYLEEFGRCTPKVSGAILQRNKKSYTLTWLDGKENYKALFTLEEDVFGGPIYRDGSIVVLSSKVEKKPTEKAAPAKKGKAKKEAPKAKKSTASSWSAVENKEAYVDSHIIPLFYLLCLQSPPKGIVFI